MDEGEKGMVIFGVALTASIIFFVVKKLRFRTGQNDLRPALRRTEGRQRNRRVSERAFRDLLLLQAGR
jgi:hypothetical protein